MWQEKMNTKLLSISIVPMLLIGSGQMLASTRVNNPESWHLSRPSIRVPQVKLGTQQPPPLYLAAKDDQQQECVWLGICDGKGKKK
jgi:hypothetical protein